MSSKPKSDRGSKPSANPNVKSSIVHKPFATGTINIFNPHRNKGKSKSIQPKLFLNAELEKDSESPSRELSLESFDSNLEPEEIEYRDRSWLDNWLNPWSISAIAVLMAINLISAGFIWRNTRSTTMSDSVEDSIAKVGNDSFSEQEFMPLNLSTLGAIDVVEDEESEAVADITPIPPALAPLNNIGSLSSFNTPYHYILTEYTGEESLSQARRKVKQVSLVNFPQGIFVYMGAFKERSQADKFITQLKQENFSAHIFPLN
ncbi:MAG: hypothetical protein AAGE96_09755 [Cyanobacteria bacterium P01_G01_bin.19]